NLTVIDSATDMLVLRPLVASHKQDIIDTATRIGTAEFAKNMPGDCGVISVNPTTRARGYRIEKEESNFDMTILDRALERATQLPIDKVIDELGKDVQVEEVHEALAGQIVLDIRHPDAAEDDPLELDGIEVRQLPFY